MIPLNIIVCPESPDALETVVSAGCQREIARKIRQKGADYVLMVKENHPVLYQEIADCFTGLDVDPHKNEQCTEWESGSEKDHGRIEERKITITGAHWYEDGSLWPDLKTFVRYHCTRRTVDATAESGWKTTAYDRYYLSSLMATPEYFGYLVRVHWSIENQLHWSLDVLFGKC
ncbi:hypothetical protein AGMMS50268_06360 [Spirochaetia bacterium]|nr:hypothetical protein AGMMS50268_06360 [Spirochaetia bacterium]